MRNRFLDATIASAAVVVMVSSLAPIPPAGPISLVSFVAVAEAAGGGGQAPTAAGKAWNRPRTADGKPDLQGIWAASVGGHTLEEGVIQRPPLFRGTRRRKENDHE